MKRFFSFLLILLSNNLFAQNPGSTDTVFLARNLAYDKKFDEANNLLTLYNLHNTDVNALRLHAQVLYWMNKFNDARLIYEKTYAAFPDNPGIQQDYGKFLFELNKLNKARKLLNRYLEKDSLHIASHSMLAYIDLWTGHMSVAKKKANWLEQHQPGNKEAVDILAKVAIYTTPYIKLNGGIYSDDQLLQRNLLETEAGVYRSWHFSPYISASLNQFDGDGKINKTLWLNGGNKFYLASTKTNIDLSAGIFQASNHAAESSWKIKLVQKITSNFSMDAAAEKKPYQYTLASIKKPFLYKVSELGLNFDRKNLWLGRAAYQYQGFGDSNSVYTVYAWLLAPFIHKDNFSIKAGYAFSYADAEVNTFLPKQTTAVPPVLNTQIEGVYDPYFTPSGQTVHSLLASLDIKFSKTVSFSSNLNVGFYAHASQPSYFVDRNGVGPFFINKKYDDYRYTPVAFSAELKANLSQNFITTMNYTYNSLIFFKSHFINLHLKYLF